MTTIDDVKKFNLKFFDEPDGRLAPIEFHKDVPFEVKRMFYVFGVFYLRLNILQTIVIIMFTVGL